MYLKTIVQCMILVWLIQSSRASESTTSAKGSGSVDRIMTILRNSLKIEYETSRLKRMVAEGSAHEDEEEHLMDEGDAGDELDEDESNSTELGMYVGGRCTIKGTCSEELDHVYCDQKRSLCLCELNFPVRLDHGRGCESPKLIGDQCLYRETCAYYDANAMCKQIGHNAVCDCKPGYHTVGIQKGVKRMFCSEDIVLLHTDLPQLFVVATGIAVLSGLLCFVLRLFSNNRFNDGGHYANAHLAPPLLFSSDNQWINGIPLTVHGRPSSRSSSQRSTAHLTHYRSKGVLVPASRAGAARAAAILLIPCHLQTTRTPDAAPSSNDEELLETPQGSRRASISSVHSNASSHLSYSQRRFEQENQQREQRAVMKAAREEAARSAVPPTPSPISTDHLLPSCEELNEDPLGIMSSTLSVPSADSLDINSLNRLPLSISGTSTKI